MAVKTADGRSARERLLAAADELFYAEGIHVVGVDRVVERAGVTKATLYNTFGSKDDLVRCYLEEHMRRRKERIARILAAHDTPRDRILGIFAEMEELLAGSKFRGCRFISAAAESRPGDASEAELAICEVNTGIFAFDADALRGALPRLRAENAQLASTSHSRQRSPAPRGR